MSSSAQSTSATEESSARVAPLIEIAVAYGLIEGALWSLGPVRYWWSLAAMIWIVGVTVYRRPALRDLGMTAQGFRQGLWIAGLAVVFGGVALAIANWTGTVHDYSPNGALAARAIPYLIWSFEQEFIVQSFMFLRFEQLVGARKAVICSALLFAIAHVPSPVLTTGSLMMGLVFCEAFRRYRNIYPLALAHWVIGLSLSLALPDFIARHMRVGIGYLRFVAR
ncbi:MAG: CPBP family intramembrane metalloprotease [Acidobacteriaceae bacterium]|nr:CPBP family intramembrane metalloprotease [Acidobacteriaceae bacterium]